MEVLESLQKGKNITDELNNIIFNNNHIAICICKPNGEIININNKLIQLTGYIKSELLHYKSTILTHPAYIQKEKTILDEAINNYKSNFEVNKQLIKCGGEIINVKSYTEIYRNAVDKIEYLFSYISEIPKIKKTLSSELNKTNEQIIKNTSNIIFTFDANGKILFTNNSFNRIFSKIQINPIRKNYSLFFNITNKNTITRLKKILQKGKTISNVETTINTTNNKRKYYSFSLAPIIKDNKIERINCIGIDISKYKKAEKLLDSSHRKLFSIIAHDLKTPFNTLLGFSDLLYENSEDMSLGEINNIANEIHKSAENGYNLVQNMLHWELSKNGTIKYNPTKINLELFFAEQITIHNTTASIKNIFITSKLHNELFVFTDENMLTTIIRNLISNALKYTNSTGSIYLDAYKKDNKINIIVTDTGIGISKSNIQQIHNNIGIENIKTNANNGFGLIICNEFIKKCNGKLLIESTPNVGSKFIVTIPIRK